MYAAFVLLLSKLALFISVCHVEKTWHICEDKIVLHFTGLPALVHFFLLSSKMNCPVFSTLIIMHMNVSMGCILS